MYNNRIITMTSNIVIVSTSSITMQQFEEQNNMGQLMHTDDIKIEIEHVPIEASPDTIEQMSLEETSNIVIVSTSSITMQQFEELDTLPWLLEPRDIELPMQKTFGQDEKCPFCGFKGQQNRVTTRQQQKLMERHEGCLLMEQ